MAEGKKIKELLAVLDMGEEEQVSYLMWDLKLGQDIYDDWEAGRINANWWLADLAFRLRDEIMNKLGGRISGSYLKGLRIVYLHWEERDRKKSRGVRYLWWLAAFVTSTDRIIAAVIAEKLIKKRNIE